MRIRATDCYGSNPPRPSVASVGQDGRGSRARQRLAPTYPITLPDPSHPCTSVSSRGSPIRRIRGPERARQTGEADGRGSASPLPTPSPSPIRRIRAYPCPLAEAPSVASVGQNGRGSRARQRLAPTYPITLPDPSHPCISVSSRGSPIRRIRGPERARQPGEAAPRPYPITIPDPSDPSHPWASASSRGRARRRLAPTLSPSPIRPIRGPGWARQRLAPTLLNIPDPSHPSHPWASESSRGRARQRLAPTPSPSLIRHIRGPGRARQRLAPTPSPSPIRHIRGHPRPLAETTSAGIRVLSRTGEAALAPPPSPSPIRHIRRIRGHPCPLAEDGRGSASPLPTPSPSPIRRIHAHPCPLAEAPSVASVYPTIFLQRHLTAQETQCRFG